MNLSPTNHKPVSVITNLNQQNASVNFRGKGCLTTLPYNLAEARIKAQKEIHVAYEKIKLLKKQLKENPENEEIASAIEQLKIDIRGIVKNFNKSLNNYYNPVSVLNYCDVYLSCPEEVWQNVPKEELSLNFLKALQEQEKMVQQKVNPNYNPLPKSNPPFNLLA